MLRIEDWREAKALCESDSEDWFRETVMSTIEPEFMEGGRSIEGNSIWRLRTVVSKSSGRTIGHCVPIENSQGACLL